MQLRAAAPALPIVPFTRLRDDTRLPRYMDELHCAPPLYKGISPTALLSGLAKQLPAEASALAEAA